MKDFLQKHFLVFMLVSLGWITFSVVIILVSKGFDFSLANLGMYGDSFNILTSLFTGLAFAGVIISVRLQKEELKNVQEEFKEQTKALNYQQQEMAIQSFDNKFFQMLNVFNNIIKNLNYENTNSLGKTVYDQDGMHRRCFDEREIYKGREVLIRIKEILEMKKIKNKEGFHIEFENFNQKYDTTFKFYFINLYQILKYIDKHLKDFEQAKNYTNIVRAQLSKDELVLLFYNAIGVIPFSGENYKKLVEKYAFFEHLTYKDLNPNGNRDIVDVLLKEYDVSAFGNNEDLKTKVLDLQKKNS